MSLEKYLEFCQANSKQIEEIQLLGRKDAESHKTVTYIKVAANGGHQSFKTNIDTCLHIQVFDKIIKPALALNLGDKFVLGTNAFDNNPSNLYKDLPAETISILSNMMLPKKETP